MSTSVHADAAATVRVSARRFEPSPFRSCYENPETVMGVYAGRYYAVANGEDRVACYWALRQKAALYDVPERPVEISGPDSVPFLEHIFAAASPRLVRAGGATPLPAHRKAAYSSTESCFALARTGSGMFSPTARWKPGCSRMARVTM
ncbi:MAG: hypothetical protein KDE08_05765 [Rhodobacteraceae bacterium]|nr:hypothetical protein [Paracoccaceae bacterium]